MKKVLGTMVAMFLLIAWPFGGIWVMLFTKIIGGGVAEGYLYPIYAGIILLAGIIVCCTVIVYEEIKELKKNQTENTKVKSNINPSLSDRKFGI